MKSYPQKPSYNARGSAHVNDSRGTDKYRQPVYPPSKLSPPHIRDHDGGHSRRKISPRARTPPSSHREYEEHLRREPSKHETNLRTNRYREKEKEPTRMHFRGAEGVDFTREELKKITVTTMIRNSSPTFFHKEVPPRFSDRRSASSPDRIKHTLAESHRDRGRPRTSRGRTPPPAHPRGLTPRRRGGSPSRNKAGAAGGSFPSPFVDTNVSSFANNRPAVWIDSGPGQMFGGSDRDRGGGAGEFPSRRRSRSPIPRSHNQRSPFHSAQSASEPFGPNRSVWQSPGRNFEPPRRDDRPPPSYRDDPAWPAGFRGSRSGDKKESNVRDYGDRPDFNVRDRPSLRDDEKVRSNRGAVREKETIREKFRDDRSKTFQERPTRRRSRSADGHFSNNRSNPIVEPAGRSRERPKSPPFYRDGRRREARSPPTALTYDRPFSSSSAGGSGIRPSDYRRPF